MAWTPATELARLIRTKAVSPVEVVRATLERIERLDPALNAFATLTPERSLAAARRAEEAVLRGGPLGPLCGVPYSIKDLTLTRGVRTTSG
ncbi:MAG: amidase, partial [Candidatus Rokubacteria bacterium]|nr:amidase [Candidatus Rokubacteria bacterium]